MKNTTFLKENKMFSSRMAEIGTIKLPTNVPHLLYMHEIDMAGNIKMPDGFKEWEDVIAEALQPLGGMPGEAFVTIDQKDIIAGDTHRRAGAHIDNIWYKDLYAHGGGHRGGDDGGGGHRGGGHLGMAGDWRGGDGPNWIGKNNAKDYDDEIGGLILASDVQACEAWVGDFDNEPGIGGDCEHFRDQLTNGILLEANKTYLANSTCIHESLPLAMDVTRTLMRISLSPVHII